MTGRHHNTGPKAAMTRSAVALLRERGVSGTSLADVLAHSGAPRGSVYHHFPGGKPQLVEEATRAAAELLSTEITRLLREHGTVGALRTIADLWRADLEGSDYDAGCPIAASALGGVSPARTVAGEALVTWNRAVAESLRREGAPGARADSLAALVLSALQGALVLARAQRSSRPLDAVVTELEAACRNAVTDSTDG